MAQLDDDGVRELVERLRGIRPGFFEYLTPALLISYLPDSFWFDCDDPGSDLTDCSLDPL